MQVEDQNTSKPNNGSTNKLKSVTSNLENMPKEAQKSAMGTRSTDSARVMKFNKELSGPTVILGVMAIYFLAYLLHNFYILVIDVCWLVSVGFAFEICRCYIIRSNVITGTVFTFIN